MPHLISETTLCFTCVKTGEIKSSSNLIKFKMMVKLHLKSCGECEYDGKLLSDKSNTQKMSVVSHKRHINLKDTTLSTDDLKVKKIHKWD